MQPVLSVRNLSVQFPSRSGLVRAVENVRWNLHAAEMLAIPGESGSGKSVSASSAMNLIETSPALIPQGKVLFEGQDLLRADAEPRDINGKSISMISQDPLAALNPVCPICWQIAETMRVHGVAPAVPHARVAEILARVGIADPERRMKDYLHSSAAGSGNGS